MAAVTIEYCKGWSYAFRYQELAGTIRQVPGVQVTGVKGRPNSFEVLVNGELIYSKLKTGTFPETDEMTEKVKEMVNEGKPVKSPKKKKIECPHQ